MTDENIYTIRAALAGRLRPLRPAGYLLALGEPQTAPAGGILGLMGTAQCRCYEQETEDLRCVAPKTINGAH